jgi:hypothetical protein
MILIYLIESCRRFEIRNLHGPEHSKYVRKDEILQRLCEVSIRSGDSKIIISPFEDVGRCDELLVLSFLISEDDSLSGDIDFLGTSKIMSWLLLVGEELCPILQF